MVPESLLREFGQHRLRRHVALAPFTSFKVGGPADWMLEVSSTDELTSAVRLATQERMPVTVLGGGSNVLIGDFGIRGLVVVVRTNRIAMSGANEVRADAGVTMNGLVRWTITRGLGGLAAWAGTPGTVGGALCGNAHFDGRAIGQLVTAGALLARDGTIAVVAAGKLEFGYDCSRLQRSGEILLWSAGALIDRAGLKGVARGGARVSEIHANFIVNEGGATAREIRELGRGGGGDPRCD